MISRMVFSSFWVEKLWWVSRTWATRMPERLNRSL